jgi:hypothetical protein
MGTNIIRGALSFSELGAYMDFQSDKKYGARLNKYGVRDKKYGVLSSHRCLSSEQINAIQHNEHEKTDLKTNNPITS